MYRRPERAKQQAQEILTKTRAQAQALMEEMDAAKKSAESGEADKAKLRSKIKELEKIADPVTKKVNEGYILPRPLKAGDEVLIFDIDRNATVIEPPDSSGKVLVQAGIIKTRVNVSDLRLITTKKKKSII